VLLGLTQYFYEGGKLLYPPLFGAWLALIMWLWRPWGQRRGLLALAGCYLLVAFPVYYLSWGSEIAYTPRLNTVNTLHGYFYALDTAGLGAFINQRYLPHLLHFFHRPDSSGFFYSDQVGLILPYLTPAFMLGVWLALWRLRLVGALLLLWLAATIAGNSLVIFASSTPRFVVAFPLVALLLAAGIRHLLPLWWPPRLSINAPLRALALVFGVQLIALPQVAFYFGPHLADYNRLLRSVEKDVVDVMYRARELPAGTDIYLFHTGSQYVATQRYLNFAVWRLDMPYMEIWPADEVDAAFISQIPGGADVAVFADPDDIPIHIALLERFGWLPDPLYSPHNPPPDRQYALYLFPAD
jgi:hypothetical protein